jgi:glycosyltransferase involved in cell wall biosynthesis
MTFGISVVLCTYNGAAFIEEQLESILNQEVLPVEVVISDDASTDETVTVVEGFLTTARLTHPEIRFDVVRNESALGVVGNFESALSRATGDLVALSDQDDRWRPSKLKILRDHFYENPQLMLVHSDALLVDESGTSMGRTLFSALRISGAMLARERRSGGFAELMKRNIVTGATVMFRRTLLRSAGTFPRSWVHDEWLAVVAAAVGKIDYESAQLIDYRQHSTNQIGAQELSWRARFERLSAHRRKRNARLLARANDLVLWLSSMKSAVPETTIALAQEKLRHENVRSNLSTNRFLRVIPVFRELFSGRYFSCGLGLQDVLRDVVQPG